MTEKNQERVEGVRVFQAKGRCSYCYQRGIENGEVVVRVRPQFNDTEILCIKCNTWKPKARFKPHPNTSSGYEHVCRFCGKLAERYGITSHDYVSLYEKQNGLCAVCPTSLELYARSTHIDHDHSCCKSGSKGCGKCVRGLLCHNCNLGLGNFKDNIQSLENAINYLKGNL